MSVFTTTLFLVIVGSHIVSVANAFSDSYSLLPSKRPQMTDFQKGIKREKLQWRGISTTITQQRVISAGDSSTSGCTPRRSSWPCSSSSSSLNASLSSIAWVASSAFGGMTGAPFVIQSTKTWYKSIPLPSYTPPNCIFAPVWTTLYTLMGIASWRIRNIIQSTSNINNIVGAPTTLSPIIQKNIIAFSLIHYAMNISWAPIFFGLKRLRAGHILNVLLVLTLLPIVAVYFSIDPVSGILLLPYLAWLGLATRLSSGVCRLNPTEVKYGCWYNNAKLQDEIWKLRKDAAKKIGL